MIHQRFTFTVAIVLLTAIPGAWAADSVDYASDVVPILQKYCTACHSEGDVEGGLSMDSHAALMAGGDSGVAVTAGQPRSSRLVLMASGKMEPAMPPDGEQGPSEDELAVISAWIEQGAVGPDGDMPVRRDLRTPHIKTADGVVAPITAIAQSPDGKRKAIARFRGVEIRSDDDQVLAKLKEEPGKVNSLQFSGDGSQLLVGSGVTGAYGRAAIYDSTTGQLIREMVGHRDTLYAAVFSPNEQLVATAGYDREIILWNAVDGEPIRKFTGHNGAIFDLAFSPDGKVLVSACADETVKVWKVDDGTRLDTLSQPEGEVFAVGITDDGKFILAGSADNRLRVWRLRSKQKPRINPIVATRFVDESPLVDFKLTPDGKALVVLSEAGNVKVIRTADWNQAATLDPLGEMGSDLTISPDAVSVTISLMNGTLVKRDLPGVEATTAHSANSIQPVYLDLGQLQTTDEKSLRMSLPSGHADAAKHVGLPLAVSRGTVVTGAIGAAGETDRYQWQALEGEVWAIDADAIGSSPLDPIVTVFDSEGQPVLRTRLQAVRDSYITFRGKDSKQVGDFRLFAWQEMHLNDYLYAAGEVTRLWMHPRGPDSGFNVYPGEGNRWTYFGTTHATHALGEPAYIVRPLERDEPAIANGLPVFNLYYENDDDPMRMAGKNSRLLFTAPADGDYVVSVNNTTGDGGDEFKYKLTIRPAAPGFKASIQAANGSLPRGAGREFIVRVDRLDGFDGEVTFDIPNVPPGIRTSAPVTIEAGQRFARGTVWVEEGAASWDQSKSLTAVARATVAGRRVERQVGSVGDFKVVDRPNVIPSIHPLGRDVAADEDWTLQVPRGETVSARVVIDRKEGFKNEVSLGKEDSGRNATHGVYVDNIGLNGLLILAGSNEREFFLTADPTAVPGKRSFFLRANVDGGVTSRPITVEVLP